MLRRRLILALALMIAASLGVTSSTFAVEPVTEDELAEVAASVRPVVERTIGLRFVEPPALKLADKNTFASAIEQRLKSLVASDARDASLRAAISIVALQRSAIARGVVTDDGATILFNSATLEEAISALGDDDTTRRNILQLVIAHAYARAADAIPAAVIPKLHTLDAFNALESLSEGWAQLVMTEYAEATDLTEVATALTSHISGEHRTDPSGAAVRRQFELHAAAGERFLRHHLDTRGWPGLLEVLTDPPLFYDAIRNPGAAVSPPLSTDALFAGFERLFPEDDEFESRRLARRLNSTDLRRTYGALGAATVNDIRSMTVHAYMHLLMTQKRSMAVTQAVTAFHIRDVKSSDRLSTYLSQLFAQQSEPFERINNEPGMSIRRENNSGREGGARWTARSVLVDATRDGATSTQQLMRQVVITHGQYMVQYLGIAEPLSENEAVAIVAQVLDRMRSPGTSTNDRPDSPAATQHTAMSRAMANASDIFEREVWTVGDEEAGQARIEMLVGSDVRATAILGVQFVAARRMTCESKQAGLLGRRQVETIVVQLSSPDETNTVASAMMSSFEQNCQRIASQANSGVTVGAVRDKQPDFGGRLARLDVEIDGAGRSTMICASIGEFVVTVLVADGDPYADGGTMLRAIPMERYAESVMRALAGSDG